jgi:hypothetical protein
VAAKDFKDPNDETPSFGGKKRRTRKRHGKGHACSKCKDTALPQSETSIPSYPVAERRGGKRKTKKFKKHYMWNTKGKRYMAKTYKQHMRGVKLGHTHKKPKN